MVVTVEPGIYLEGNFGVRIEDMGGVRKSGYENYTKAAKDLLVGQSASAQVEEKIIQAAKSFPSVKEVLDLRTVHLGTEKLLVNMEVNLVDKLTTDEIERLIDKIEKEIKKDVPTATNIQIELETPDV